MAGDNPFTTAQADRIHVDGRSDYEIEREAEEIANAKTAFARCCICKGTTHADHDALSSCLQAVAAQ